MAARRGGGWRRGKALNARARATFSPPPLEGEVGEPQGGEPGGVKSAPPHPGSSHKLAADPPPQSTSDVSDFDKNMLAEPGEHPVRREGEARITLGCCRNRS